MKEKEYDLKIGNLDSESFGEERNQLKKNGYTRIENAYWIEVWKKGEWTVCIERA